MDGIGPAENRKKMINNWWGGFVEDNSFGTHEFMRLCELLECEPYLCGNVGSGTVKEMSEWIEYLNSDSLSPMTQIRKENGREKPFSVRLFGVGNENWGCGGNMTAVHYANEFRRYQTYCRNYGDNKLYKVACGHDYEWNDTLLKIAAGYMDGMSIHYYTIATDDWYDKVMSTGFNKPEYYHALANTLKIEEIIKRNIELLDKYDPQKRIGLVIDEWGAWYNVEPGTNPGFLYQQNTMRDAIIAAVNGLD